MENTTRRMQHKRYSTRKPKVLINQKQFQKSGKEKVKEIQYKYNTKQYYTHSVYTIHIYFIQYNTEKNTKKNKTCIQRQVKLS